MIQAGTPLDRFYSWLSRKSSAFKRCFRSPDGRTVLVDLAPFCFANAPTTTEREAGRRDVWLRIAKMVQMDDEELAVLFAELGPEQRHQLWHPSTSFLPNE